MKTKNFLQIIKTADGSPTLKSEQFGQTYHSIHGAVSESQYVFIENGLAKIEKNPVSVLEIGFGTGLNALLTFKFAKENNLKIFYDTIEKYPVNQDITQNLKYTDDDFLQDIFNKMHSCKPNKSVKISENFILTKYEQDLLKTNLIKKYNIIYFDAFSYDVQPEMWSIEIFRKLRSACEKDCLLVTYSAKGIVKNNLREAGFTVKRLPGFKKHHMLLAMNNVYTHTKPL